MNWRRNYDFETRNEERLSWLNVQLAMITEGTATTSLDNFLYRNMLVKTSHGSLPDCRQSWNHLAHGTSERDVLLRRPVRIRAWHPCRMAKNLEMDGIFAL